jgi:hypothetical protein
LELGHVDVDRMLEEMTVESSTSGASSSTGVNANAKRL